MPECLRGGGRSRNGAGGGGGAHNHLDPIVPMEDPEVLQVRTPPHEFTASHTSLHNSNNGIKFCHFHIH